MGATGRKVTPAAIKIRRATWRTNRDVLPSQEPQPPAEKPTMPEGLDTIAAAKWKQLVKNLEAMELCTIADADLYELYAKTWSAWTEATANGKPTAPLATLLTRLMEELGLTPTARARIGRSAPKPLPRVEARVR